MYSTFIYVYASQLSWKSFLLDLKRQPVLCFSIFRVGYIKDGRYKMVSAKIFIVNWGVGYF